MAGLINTAVDLPVEVLDEMSVEHWATLTNDAVGIDMNVQRHENASLLYA